MSIAPRTVALLVFDEVEVLDFAGPFEVFGVADELAGGTAWRVVTVSPRPGTVRTRHGLKLDPHFTTETCPPAEILVVPGGYGTRALLVQAGLLDWLRHRTRAAEIVLSVCTGSLLLGRAGLLDGLRVTTHASALDRLAAEAPRATIDPGQRFHDNGRIITAAGISAGIDASLHVVGRLLGPAAASATARYLEYHAAATP